MKAKKRRFKPWLLAICLASLGCAPPEAPAPAAPAPAQWAGGQDDGADAPVRAGWIHSFADRDLSRLVREAQMNNQDLAAAAAAGVEKAWALARLARAPLTPAVNLSAEATRSGATHGEQILLGVQAGWEADVWGRVRAGEHSAVAAAQAAEFDARYARHSIAAAVAKAYFVAIEAGQQRQLARRTVAALEETLRIVEVRRQNGLATLQDVALSRSDLAVSKERLAAVEGSGRDALRALEALLGRYPEASLSLRQSLPDIPSPPPAGVPSQLLRRRPDIIAAERRVAAAFGAAQQARAARLPTINLTGSLGGASDSLSSLLNPGNLAWTLGTGLLAPIIDGGAAEAREDSAVAEQRQAMAAFGQTALAAFVEVEKTLDSGVVLERRRIELALAAAEIERAQDIVRLRHQEGEVALLEVLSVQQRAFSARGNLLSVHRALLEQRINLHLALGGDWDE